MLNSESTFITQLSKLIGCKLPQLTVDGLALDSRKVQPNYCFLALSGHQQHGAFYNELAVEKGASLILCDTNEMELHGQTSLIANVTCVFVCDLNQQVGLIAALFYQQPSALLNLIGVTGTNGKTSVCDMLYQMSNSLAFSAGYVGTLGVKYINNEINTGLTTPDPITLQAYLADFVDANVKLAALEVSSHAIVQNRIAACHFKQVAFTNLSHDHLDYHQDMKDYFLAKARLFSQNPDACHVINTDDFYGVKLVKHLKQLNPSHCEYLLAVGRQADLFSTHFLKLDHLEQNEFGFELSVSYQTKQNINAQVASFNLPLLAEFNVENTLIAMACLLNQGFSLEQVSQAAQQLKPISGRMETFDTVKKVKLVVDFAHTPEGLSQAIMACKTHCKGELIVVFGCGGDRDHTKRAKMGAIAAQFADQIILTNDNPRSEVENKIIADISLGMVNKPYLVELDRKQAIRRAYQQAKAGDWVLIAGKGHETYQEFASGKVDYNERAFVAEFAEAGI